MSRVSQINVDTLSHIIFIYHVRNLPQMVSFGLYRLLNFHGHEKQTF